MRASVLRIVIVRMFRMRIGAGVVLLVAAGTIAAPGAQEQRQQESREQGGPVEPAATESAEGTQLVPEPATLAMFGVGLTLVASLARRRRRRPEPIDRQQTR